MRKSVSPIPKPAAQAVNLSPQQVCSLNVMQDFVVPSVSHYQANTLVKPRLPPGVGRSTGPRFGESFAADNNNSPVHITTPNGVIEKRYDVLPKSVNLSQRSWGPRTPGVNAWSFAQGGIARPSAGQVESPAAKYDQVFNRLPGQSILATHYDATNYENWAHSAAGDPKYWYGHCDGLAAAEALCPQPKRSVSYWVPDGKGGFKSITFTPQDIKALASEALMQMPRQAVGSLSHDEDVRMGMDATGRPLSAKYRDVNPGTYHIVRANQLQQGRVIIVDDVLGAEVQNKPVYAFANHETVVSAADAQRLVTGQGGHYAFNPAAAQFVYVQSTELLPEGPRQLNYVLELDANKTIVGGEWVGPSRYHHPDSVWLPKPERIPVPNEDGAPSGNPGVKTQIVMQLLKMSAGP